MQCDHCLSQIISRNDLTSTVATFSASLTKHRPTPLIKITHNKLVTPQDTQAIPRIFWGPKVHYSTHKPSPPVLVLSDINSVLAFPIHAF